MRYIDSVSKVLQSVEKTGNSQQTINDAIMALLLFNGDGERRIPEPSEAECEATRVQNWIRREQSTGEKTSIKTACRGHCFNGKGT